MKNLQAKIPTQLFVLGGMIVLVNFILGGCNTQEPQSNDLADSETIETPSDTITSAPVTMTPSQTATIPLTHLPTEHTPTGAPQIPTETHIPTQTLVPTKHPTETTIPTPISTNKNSIIIDSSSVALFDHIPEQYIEAAADLHMLYIDRSVGSNINDALNCLSMESNEVAPNHCQRNTHNEPKYTVSPENLTWQRTGGYDRSNWVFLTWEGSCDYWYEKVTCFTDMIEPIIDKYDVVSFQFSYLSVGEGSTIADQPGGYLWDNEDIADVYDQEAFEAQYPNKHFIYWTTSLARSIGTDESDVFNEQMRQYSVANGKILFDVADILSHDPDGNPCYDNRDGVLYDNGSTSENYPDDGQNHLAICPHYTSEVDGGHLGRVSAGKIRVAKAFWVLMAHLAGWDGSVN